MNLDEKKLAAAGFAQDETLHAECEAHAIASDMHATGPYVVHGVWRKGTVTLLFEQNTAEETLGGGLNAVISHPAVCVIEGSKGRAACNPNDLDHVLRLAAELA